MLPEVLKLYGGKVGLEFRHNPLPFHNLAMPAAEASVAAGLQGRFWEMHDLIFRNRANLTAESFVAFARQLGLDLNRFQWDLADPRVETFVRQDIAAVSAIGLKGTPMFVINGTVIRGAQPTSEFQKVIDAEIAKAEQALASGTPRDQLEEALARANGADERFIKHFIKGEAPEVAPSAAGEKKNAEAAEGVDRTVWKVPVSGNDAVLGPANAPLTIVEFSDFQCPYCARVTATLKRVLEEHGQDVRLVFKNYPLPFHKEALLAAEAAMAAGAQGRFWEMHDLLFAGQDKLSIADLEKHAEALKLDMSRFRSDIASHRFKEIIEKQMEEAGAVGVRGTPNLFFNGRLVKGAQPYENIKNLVEEEIRNGKELKASGVGDPYSKIIADGKVFSPFGNETKEISLKAAPVRGAGEEAVLVVFSDFECPYCKKLAKGLDEALAVLGTRGKLVYKAYPLDRHKNARRAALAALAAGEQGKFWEMHDQLFESMEKHEDADLERYAGDLGLDVVRFKQDMSSPALAARIDADIAEGKAVGVDGTPTLFVNGRRYEGAAESGRDLANAVDKLLSAR